MVTMNGSEEIHQFGFIVDTISSNQVRIKENDYVQMYLLILLSVYSVPVTLMSFGANVRAVTRLMPAT